MSFVTRIRRAAGYLVAAWAAWHLAGSATAHAASEVVSAGTSFESHGKKILVDVFEPKSHAALTDVLVLHGAGGMFFDGPEMKRVARQLAENNLRAWVIHYFDGSGVVFTPHDAVLRKHHDEWLAVVRDAVVWVRQQEGTPSPPRPVAIYGYSMGAFLGIEASSDNPGVGALTEQSGGDWDNQPERIGRMPPVLMIHGREDRRVPFGQYAVPLAKLLRQRGGHLETLFFDHEGHGLGPAAQARACAATIAFFARQLPGENPASKAGKPVRPGGGETIPSKQPSKPPN